MKRNFKKDMVLVFGAVLVMFLALMVSAATTITSPTASSIVKGLTNFTVNCSEELGENYVNITFYAKSSLTANSSWSVIGSNNSLNLTLYGNESTTAIDIDYGLLEDANNYIFNATCANASSGAFLSDDTNIGITIDNTIPQAPSGITPAGGTVQSSATTQTFSSTVVNSNTTACTYTIYRYGSSSDSKSASGSTTYSATTCSFTKTISDINDNGIYYVVITASDGSNTTSSSPISWNVAIAGNSGGLPPGTYTDEGGQTFTVASDGSIGGSNYVWWGVGIIIFIVVVIFIIKKAK